MPSTVHILESPRPGIEPGAHLSELFRSGGPGTRILLAPRSLWLLESVIKLSHDDQELATQGYPEDDAHKAILRTVGKDVATAVDMGGLKWSRLRNLFIDGNEPAMGRTETAHALVFMAGPGSEDQLLEQCVLQHTRGWTCCHIFDHGLRPRIINNRVGPSGYPAPNGPWADGLSVACRDGIVAGNVITDATDGGIVVFCAPGTVVVNNTIIAKTRNLLGGINAVDSGPFDGDYTNTRIVNNAIISDGAYIKLGIGIGSRPWGLGQGVGAYGGFVLDNTFGPGTFGYAMAVGGARDMTVQGNKIDPATVFEGQAVRNNPAAQPFVKYIVPPEETGGRLQDEFVQGQFAYLIGIEPGLARNKKYYAGGLQLNLDKSIELREATLELQKEGRLVLWGKEKQGRILWSTPSPRKSARMPAVKLSRAGILEIRDFDDTLIWSSSTAVPPRSLPHTSISDASLTVSDEPPFVCIGNAAEDLIFVSTPRIFGVGWSLRSGHYISLSSSATGKPGWLVLDPDSTRLVLHFSKEPLEIDGKSICWRSPNGDLKWDRKPEHSAWAQLQGDFNLVLYGHEKGALWASGTNGGEPLPYLGIYGPEDPGGMRIELLSEDLKPRWSSKLS